MWYFLYFLISISVLLFILALDVRIKGKNYKTDWDDMAWIIPVSIFWPCILVTFVFMAVVGFPIVWILEQLGKLNIGAKFDKLLIKLFSKKDKNSS